MTDIIYSTPPPKQSLTPYLVVIFGMVFTAITGTVLVFIFRPAQDNTAIVASILGFVGSTLAALMAFMKTQETHLIVNSRMDEFKQELRMATRLATAAARAEGVTEGKQEADVRVDKLIVGVASARPPVAAVPPILPGASVALVAPVEVVLQAIEKSGQETAQNTAETARNTAKTEASTARTEANVQEMKDNKA